MRHPASLGLALVLCFGSAQAGTLYFSADSTFDGLYRLDTTSGASTLLGESGVTSETVGLAASDTPGVLWGSVFEGINAINADGSGSAAVGAAEAEALTYDSDGGTLYGASNGEFFELSTADLTTMVALAAPGDDVEGLAYGGDGIIYGLSSTSATAGVLYRYDIVTDSWIVVGDTGVDFMLVGLAYDSDLDVLYAKGEQDSLLYSIDPISASASVVGDTGLFPGGGLAFVADAGPSEVPAPATSMLMLIMLGVVRRRGSRRRAA